MPCSVGDDGPFEIGVDELAEKMVLEALGHLAGEGEDLFLVIGEGVRAVAEGAFEGEFPLGEFGSGEEFFHGVGQEWPAARD